MKLCLINLPTIVQNRNMPYHQTPPLGIAYLAASVRQAGHEVEVVDGLGEALEQFSVFMPGHESNGLSIDEMVARVDPACGLIGVSVMFSNHWPLARRLIAALREALPSIPIVAGGEHVSATISHVFDSSPVDYAVSGEGEETLVELMDTLAGSGESDVAGIAGLAHRGPDGQCHKHPPRARQRDLDAIPWPAWDLVPVRKYVEANHYHEPSNRRVLTMLATRGCPYQCKFCSNPQMWTTRFYVRDPKDIVDEMESYEREYGVTEFQFQDLTFIIKKQWVIEVADEILRRKLDYVWKLPTGTRSEAFDVELLSKISASGCTSLTLAPETGSKRISKELNKPVDLDRFVEIGRMVRRNGIEMTLNFFMIVGSPGEKLRDVLDSYYFMARMAIAGFGGVGINKFITYPGSVYHQEFLDKGLIEYSDEYFLGLRIDSRFEKMNEGVEVELPWSERQLWLIMNFGYALYYAVYYLSDPRRIARSVLSVLRDEPVTRLEDIFNHALIEPVRRRLVRALRPG